ncbi:KamA family radical SAM protein [bacterium]|nr:KamA family radical SAM protein [bacterium]
MLLNEQIIRLWECNPDIYDLLRRCSNVIDARIKLNKYLAKQHDEIERRHEWLHPLDYDLMCKCLVVLQTITGDRSDHLSNFSVMKTLWGLAQNLDSEIATDLSEGFFEEIRHLFLGIRGSSGLYERSQLPLYQSMSGRDAAFLRSKDLEHKAQLVREGVNRYPSGLQKDVALRRAENKQNILDYFHGNEQDWHNHVWQLKHIIRDAKTLSCLIELTDEERKAIELAREYHLPFGITPYYVSLMDREPSRNNDHAVRAQVIPPMSYVEHMIHNRNNIEYSSDFMLEQDTSPVDLVTRRYPNIAILKPYNTCSQICVYCQRNWEIDDAYAKKALPPKEKITRALKFFEQNPGLDEVLVTGGDPLVMKDDRIIEILDRLAQIEHIQRIRIGSRTPVVLPMRITQELVGRIAAYHVPGQREIAIVTHFEHVYEITEDALIAVQKFRLAGMSLYNQMVFTFENSRRFEAVALRKLLRLIGIDPYYTFNTKGKEETNEYRVPIARLEQEMVEEARLTSGLVRADAAVYNVPRLGKNYLRAQQQHRLISILPDGRRVYEFLPWESRISLVDTYIDTDVSIHEYLEKLKTRGENPHNYESIYYYF